MALATLSTLVIAIAGFVGLEALQGKPIKSEILNTYFKAPPETLDGMVAEADLVVRGRILAAPTHSDRAGTGVVTDYRVKLDEIIRERPDLPVSDEVTFSKMGGDLDRGEYVQRVIQGDFPPLEPGHDYVLFLAWNHARQGWVPAYGPDSVLDISSGDVQSPGRSSVTQASRGRPAPDVLDALRRSAGRTGR